MYRVIFKKGEQKQFIELVCGKNIRQFCKTHKNIGVPYSTLKKYRSESLNLPFDFYIKLKKIKYIKKGFNIKLVDIKTFLSESGKRGIKTLLSRYDIKTFKKWRSKGGKNSGNSKRIKINYPDLNSKLAEFIGAYLGDGTLTDYFIRISGDKRYDLPYLKYLANLTKKLFGLNPSIKFEKNRNLAFLEIRSKCLCEFLEEKFDIHPGNKIKNKTTIPIQIIKSKELFMHCLRGLIDTDGSVSKDNKALSLRFSSNNPYLLTQIYGLGKKYSLFTFSRRSNEIGTKNKNKILKYFKTVGSSNLRHIVRFEESLIGNILKKEKVNLYYNKYENLNLPYFGPMV